MLRVSYHLLRDSRSKITLFRSFENGLKKYTTSSSSSSSSSTVIKEKHHGVIKKQYLQQNHHKLVESNIENKDVSSEITTSTNGNISNVINKEKMVETFQKLFLPSGYPESVSNDYAPYQRWIFVQNTLGSVTYMLSTHALLTSVGVGLSASLPFSAAISWVLKDGLGASALVLFASRYSTSLDFDLKRFKFRGDFLHNFGVFLETCTPFVPGYFLLLASVSNLAKGIAGLIYGSTRASLHKSFALKENIGDITAKYQSQAMTSYLTGMAIGTTLGLSMVQMTTLTNLSAVFGLSMIHMYCGYRALKSIKFRTLNRQRASILIKHWLRSNNQELLTIDQVNNHEDFILPNKMVDKLNITFGVTVEDAFSVSDVNSIGENVVSSILNDSVSTGLENEQYRYLLRMKTSEEKRKYQVVIIENQKGSVDNMNLLLLKSYFHALVIEEQYLQKQQLPVITTKEIEQQFNSFFENLQKQNKWNINYILFETNDIKISI